VPDAPVLSVVTPAYDAIRHLADAIDSVEQLAQTLSLEHVVADGASDDGTREYLVAADYVRGISQADQGLYSALNWTLDQVRGRYVQWINADDRLCPTFTRRAVELLDANEQIDAVLGNTLFVGADGRIEETWRYDPYRAADLWSRADGYFFNLNSAVIRTACMRRVGKFDQARYPVAADLDFEMRLLLDGIDLVVLDEPAYVFRRHSGSLTGASDAIETVMRSGWRLFDRWSENPGVDAALGDAFRHRARELRLGWALQRLRDPRRRRVALGELAEMFIASPIDLASTAAGWFEKKVRGGFVPMKRTKQS
jgi:glycosyltransferase involved in cell wall biosynthesis